MTDDRLVFVKISSSSFDDQIEAAKMIRDCLEKLWKCNVDVFVSSKDIEFIDKKEAISILKTLEQKTHE